MQLFELHMVTLPLLNEEEAYAGEWLWLGRLVPADHTRMHVPLPNDLLINTRRIRSERRGAP